MSNTRKSPGMAEADTLPGLLPQIVAPASSAANSPASPAAEGHRSRMRQRLLHAGPDALADHEMLEMILFLALPRRDTKSVARALLGRFQTFAGVVSAPASELMSTDGMAEAGAAALKLIQAAALRMMRKEIAAQTVLSTWDKLTAYLTAAMEHERVEQFRLLFLDSRNRLIADEIQGHGTINHAPAYPREVVRRCLELHASAVILAHNHPSGDPSPSREDVALTTDIARAAALMGIAVHDHIIVGRGKWLSFRAEKLL